MFVEIPPFCGYLVKLLSTNYELFSFKFPPLVVDVVYR